jgi:hypothetical protein
MYRPLLYRLVSRADGNESSSSWSVFRPVCLGVAWLDGYSSFAATLVTAAQGNENEAIVFALWTVFPCSPSHRLADSSSSAASSSLDT